MVPPVNSDTPELVIPAPFDAHLHLRQPPVTAAVAPHSRWAGRVLVMPNTDPPVTDGPGADAYARLCGAAVGPGTEVLVAIKLTPHTTPVLVRAARLAYGVRAAKLYPDGATHNSTGGIPREWLVRPLPTPLAGVLGAMADCGMVLCCHGEMPGEETFAHPSWYASKAGCFWRWLDYVLWQYPGLRVVLEHISSGHEVELVGRHQHRRPDQLGATITPHHLWLTDDDVAGTQLRPHNYCLPRPRSRWDRSKLAEAATSGHCSFFLGTDSAPHAVGQKECASGCAGVFNAPAAVQTLAEVFDREGALSRLAAFTSTNGERFYGLEPTRRRLRLVRREGRIPAEVLVPNANGTDRAFRPWRGGEAVPWSFEEVTA